jgi:hypothetical protein
MTIGAPVLHVLVDRRCGEPIESFDADATKQNLPLLSCAIHRRPLFFAGELNEVVEGVE